ncbi:hypothetical protein C0J52_17161 [Blattella germanica]|nr:hypothetical protein C0J52_17161 [Blattella germanica]
MDPESAMEHHSLENLALERFGKYVSEILDNLIERIQEISTDDLKFNYLRPICDFLEDFIYKNVPPRLADIVTEVTVRLLMLTWKCQKQLHFDRTWKRHLQNQRGCCRFCETELYRIHEDFVEISRRIAVQIAISVSHQSITSLQYDPAGDYDFQMFYFEGMLRKANHLKELVLWNMPRFEMFPNMKTLEFCSWGKCTDETLAMLADSAAELRYLRVTDSEESMTDRSIDFILKFCNLTHLDISCTHISPEGKERLFEGLGFLGQNSDSIPDCRRTDDSVSEPRKTCLNYLSLDLQPSDVNLIIEHLQELTALELVLFEECNLIPLKQLKRLVSLSIRNEGFYSAFSPVGDLIREVGARLVILRLHVHVEIDMKLIAEHCTSLKSFTLSINSVDYPFRENISDEDLSEYFSFQMESVEFFELYMAGKHIWKIFPFLLSCFVNLRRVSLYTRVNSKYKNVSLEDCLLHPLKEGLIKELIFNGNKIQYCGEHSVITSDKGYSVIVAKEDLEKAIKCIEEGREIQNFGKQFRIIPRKKLRCLGLIKNVW